MFGVYVSSPEHSCLVYSFTSIKMKEIALEITAKVASVNGPLESSRVYSDTINAIHFKNMIRAILQKFSKRGGGGIKVSSTD